ncbi:hypothetical protein VP1G_03395 [Cytospora mali]|uniref:Cat eye syndrome critical region protein 5 n=1 Tax=Cytospora mali TaxID=578113 RepID=A0A194UW96_CYTMA|nr:hypothetical protein VP1G_03395 [Valsa mali var. pyri (nom. inval.)]
MSASSRAARALPLLRSGLSRRADEAVRRCCGASVPLSKPVQGRYRYHSRGLAARQAWEVGGLRWYSTEGKEGSEGVASERESLESVSSESSSSQSGESVVSSATSVSSEEAAVESGHSVPQFAFAFDIDGVLLHSSKPIPGATETLKYLQQHRIPFLLLTNGGGKSEAERVADLSSKLGVELDISNFVQSHTPYQRLLNKDVDMGYPPLELYLKRAIGSPRLSGEDNTILVLGSDASKARRIANGYGFKSVVTPADILKANPEIFPFDPLEEFYAKQEVLPLPKPVYSPTANPAVKLKDCLKIDAILVFNDPRDWAVDVQLVMDLILSHRGYLGTYSPKNGDQSLPIRRQWQNDGQPPIIFSNADLLWSTGYHQSRLGQGAFRATIMRVFERIIKNAGCEYQAMRLYAFGKPEVPTYWHAWHVLQEYYLKLQGETGAGAGVGVGETEGQGQGQTGADNGSSSSSSGVLRRVHMVGDNPESDIRGVNAWNRFLKQRPVKEKKETPIHAKWMSYLVKTGVWAEDKVPLARLHEKSKPDRVVNDVREAVNVALKEEGWPGRVEFLAVIAAVVLYSASALERIKENQQYSNVEA